MQVIHCKSTRKKVSRNYAFLIFDSFLMTQYIVNPHTNRIAYFYTTLETYLNESLSPDYKVKDAILNFFYFEKLMC